MNISDVWDWTFFWQMFRNFTASAAPFVMIPVVIIVVGLLIGVIISAINRARA